MLFCSDGLSYSQQEAVNDNRLVNVIVDHSYIDSHRNTELCHNIFGLITQTLYVPLALLNSTLANY